MKKSMQLILFACLLVVGNNFAQKSEKISIDEYISFIKKAETEYLIKKDYGFSAKEKYTKEEIKDIKRNVFLANRNGKPTLSKEIFTKETKEIKNKWKGNREEYGKHFSHSQTHVVDDLMKILRVNIPSIEYKLLNNDIIIKGKILKREKKFESIDETTFKVHLNWFEIEVEDIIIGDSILKQKDVINVYFLSEWYIEESLNFPNAVESESFIFRLRDNGIASNPRRKTRYAIIADCLLLDGEYVLDPKEYFENGKKIEWSTLKDNLNSVINNIVL